MKGRRGFAGAGVAFAAMLAFVLRLNAAGAAALLPNGGFEQIANGRPVGWSASSPQGWLVLPGEGEGGSTAIGVEDAGTNNCKWVSSPVALNPGLPYGFAVRVKGDTVRGLTTGTAAVSVTEGLGVSCEDWTDRRMVVCPTSGGRDVFRLGEYHVGGRILFDNARVIPLRVEWAERDGVRLGHGERIAGRRYSFATRWNCVARLHARPFRAMKGLSFNTDRAAAYAGSWLEYVHEVTGRRWRSAAVTFSGIGAQGPIEISASTDGETWVRLGTPTNISSGGTRMSVPSSMFPAERLFVRLAVGTKGSVQLAGYSFDGELDGPEMSLVGSSRYVDVATGEEFARIDAPSFYTEGYGAALAAPGAPFVAWTALSGWKIPKSRPAPDVQTSAIRVSAAANETEAVQLVLRSAEDLDDVLVTCGELHLANESGAGAVATLPASAVEILRVGYVPVVRVKDSVGCADDWPDTLLPQDAADTPFTPRALKAGENAPYWIRVTVPKGTPGGVYCGNVSVRTAKGVSDFPLELEVYGFELPDQLTCRTAFGMHADVIYRYHRLKTQADRRKVLDFYFRSLAAHHVSPYDPAPGVRWKVWWKDGEPVFDWSAWDAAMEEAFTRYGFTSFRLSGPLGLGGGNEAQSFPGFVPGSDIKDTSPKYERLEGKYLAAIERHLREKGWLGKAYIYAYDEPRPGADRLVMRGLGLAAKYAPGIDRLLTAPVRESLIGGPNIWCPTAPDLHAPGSDARRAAGDRFWWYVCMCPKPPYPSLFIDHLGVDLRVWLWQSWREKIEGILIWNTTWWTSKLAYPDPKHPQNPYLDTTAWSPRYHGVGASNGDGRFFYPPPEACAAFDEEREIGPVLSPPIETIRLEYVRDGLEDFEYFTILKRLDPDNPLLEVPPEVSASLTQFSIDPAHMERHRRKLAAAIAERKTKELLRQSVFLD